MALSNILLSPIRKTVSQNRSRFREDGFDLDLARINDRIIAHGFPSSGIEYFYRNPRSEVRRFLEKYHSNHYFLYNFCIERTYDHDFFEGRVNRFPFHDHGCPTLQLMVDFANAAKIWLDRDKSNICCLHCKAGKGRTGVMSCVLLLRCGYCWTAEEAIRLFNERRTVDSLGLTHTNQQKYVKFYEILWRNIWQVETNIGDEPVRDLLIPNQPKILINFIEILNSDSKCNKNLQITIYRCTEVQPELVYDCGVSSVTHGMGRWSSECYIRMDFMIKVEECTTTGNRNTFEFWHNTLFLNLDDEFEGYGWDDLDVRYPDVIETFGQDIRFKIHASVVRK